MESDDDEDNDARETTPHWPGVEKAEAVARTRIKDRSRKVIMVLGVGSEIEILMIIGLVKGLSVEMTREMRIRWMGASSNRFWMCR
jgi:hypothetical protein